MRGEMQFEVVGFGKSRVNSIIQSNKLFALIRFNIVWTAKLIRCVQAGAPVLKRKR